MAKRGPKKKLNMVRKWWRMHRITEAQIEILLTECRAQLPLIADKVEAPMIIAALISREVKKIEEELFDVNELMDAFRIEDEFEEEVEAETAAR